MNTTTPQAQENLKSAFPYSYIDNTRFGVDVTVYDVGMTLRDYFAAKAMNGMVTGIMSDIEQCKRLKRICEPMKMSDSDYIAEQAYLWADAMLAARTKEQSK